MEKHFFIQKLVQAQLLFCYMVVQGILQVECNHGQIHYLTNLSAFYLNKEVQVFQRT